jgi:hypothetical protein
LLSSKELTNAELKRAKQLYLKAKRIGAFYYPQFGEVHEYSKTWITANSHYMSHVDDFTYKFGVPRNTWVFVFESCNEFLKRYLDAHRNGKSEGASMLTFWWRLVGCSFFLENAGGNILKEDALLRKTGRILRLKDHRVVVLERILQEQKLQCRNIRVDFWQKDTSRIQTEMEGFGEPFVIEH